MANNAGAKKAIRKIAARTEVNKSRRTRVRTFLRKFQEAVAGGDAEAAKGAFITAQSELMRAVSKGVVHKNTGSRKVGRLAAQLKKMGLRCAIADNCFAVEPSPLTAARRITTGLWPGFPSDMVSLVTVLATQAEGETLVHDWMYELRLFALEQMSGMGADLFLCDPHRIIVTGPRRLRGKSLDSRDIRSGMALIAAALIADGQSRVEPLETVERGYSQLVDRLLALGAKVAKVE